MSPPSVPLARGDKPPNGINYPAIEQARRLRGRRA